MPPRNAAVPARRAVAKPYPSDSAAAAAKDPFDLAIASIRFPDTPLCRSVVALARQAHPEPFAFNHHVRVFFWASLVARRDGVSFDTEVLFVAAMLYHLGYSEKFRGPQRYEVQGADVARDFLRAKLYPEEKVGLVWTAIALHSSLGIASKMQAEVAMLHRGASMDAMGIGLDTLDSGTVDQILAAYPRDGFKKKQFAVVLDHCQRNPTAIAHTWMMDVARHSLPAYECPTFQQLMDNSPFPD
jgi:hypothetical protein